MIQLTPNIDTPQRRRGPVEALLISMRPKQWTKNLLLFAGVLFTLDTRHSLREFLTALAAFGLFCIASSAVYLVNDVADREGDRKHPRKCRRPIAAGELSPNAAIASAAIGGIGAVVASFLLNPLFGAIVVLYLAETFLYSFTLKHVVIVDVLVLATGFVLRALAGTVAVGVLMSPWLLLCTLMLAMFLGLSKRRAEILAMQNSGIAGTRRILTEYTPQMLDQMIVIVTSSCLMSYALYTILSKTASHHHYMVLTIPFVMYGIFRYLYLVHRRALGEAPDAILLSDKPMIVNLALWAAVTTVVMTGLLDRSIAFTAPWRW